MTARVLDHVTIGCASLAQGIAYVRERLGVEVPAGGQHPRMGTHNRPGGGASGSIAISSR